MARQPLVSVCIPTFNSSRWIGEALASALAQEYANLEVVVVDNASTDDTVARVAALEDPRVFIQVNPRNVGAVRNFNRCIRMARGEYVKLLMSDDLLFPDCARRMVELFEGRPDMGLVFSTRAIHLEDPSDGNARRWKEAYGKLHTQFERLGEVNDGRDLFRQYLRKGFRMNFVGEPSCVMVRQGCFSRLGMFNTRMHQGCDFEMWARIMYYYGVGFIDRDLSAFRVHTSSSSSHHHRSNKPWLDMLWLVEGLLRHDEIRRDYPEIQRLRYVETARILRSEAQRLARGMPPPVREHARSLAQYWEYRWKRRLHVEPDIHREIA
jgi:glycosyltransferase involved in cell wall biosynthesis